MNLSWVGLFLFCCGWLFAVAVFEPLDASWPYLMGAGVLLFAVSLPNLRFERIPKRVYLLSPGPALFALLIPYPYKVVGLVPLAGFALLLLCHKIRRLAPVAGGLLLAGGVLLLQSLALALFYFLSPGLKDAGFFSPILYAALRAAGSDATLGDGLVYVSTIPEIMRLWPTWDHLGLFHILLVTSGAIPLLALSSSPRKRLPLLLAVTAAYFTLRYLVFGIIEGSGAHHEMAWSNSWNAISLLPLFILLTYWIPLRSFRKGTPARLGGLSLGMRQLGFGALLVIATFAMACYAALPDGGIKKQGRVLLDEYHSDWEWTEEEFDTEWYGMKSGYNYYNLFEYLNYFYGVKRGSERLTPEVLSDYDVLIIKTPTKRFDEEEIESIVRFVEDGGGLYLVGDHTNVFGTSTYLNKISERFGFWYRYDSTYDLRTGALSLYETSRLLPHAVVQNMPTFLFATSCSIEGGPLCRPVINGYRLRTVAADYSQTSFFPEKKSHRDYGFGLFTQAISAKRGKGRVVGFSDSTVFSNFFMFIPGKPELLLGTMEWLNRKNRVPTLDLVLAAAFILTLLLALLSARGIDPLPRGLIAITSVLLALPLSLAGVRELNARSYPPAEPHTKFTQVSFESRHSWFFVPMFRLARTGDNDFATFYVWTQRLGLIPNVSWSVEEAIDKGNLIAFIDPRVPFTSEEGEKLGGFVEDGGSVLLMDDRTNRLSSANQLLSFFGMEIDTTRIVLGEEDLDSEDAFLFDQSGSVVGGIPWVSTSVGDPIISYVRKGSGMVMACSNSHLFEAKSMGVTGTEPTDQQMRIYQLEFDMLRMLLKLKE